MRTCLLLALFGLNLLPAWAVDMTPPAQVQVTVRDAAGHPLPDAAVTLGDAPGEDTLTLSPDGRGLAERHIPPDLATSQILWRETLRVRLAGYLPYEANLYSLFPGTRVERLVMLKRSRTTTLSLRDARGRPLAGVSPSVEYEEGPDTVLLINGYTHLLSQQTDDSGRLVFTHPPMRSGFRLSVGTFEQHYPDRPEVAVTVPMDKLPPPIARHMVELTLIAPDGRPAAGWFVAPNAQVTSSGSIVGGIVFPPTYTYGADKFIQAGPNGIASFRQSEDHLVVCLPQGVPFLYPVLPETWPVGSRRITLRLPPVRRTQTGQVVYPDGTPAAGLPALPGQGHSDGQDWEFSQDPEPGAFSTDAAGRYTVPVYFGMETQYAARAPRYATAGTLTTQSRSVLYYEADPAEQKPTDCKHITLRFVDEQGRSLPDVTANCMVFAGKDEILGTQAIQDARASHVFVPTKSDRLDLEARREGNESLRQSLNLSGAGDQAFTITLPDSLRLHPLSGVLLAADGRPVSGVTVSLFGINPRPGSINNDALPFYTTTDARGRFAFPAAPASCEIGLSRFDKEGRADLPGWTDPPVISPQTRDVVIRLEPTGSVRALLPPDITVLPPRVFLDGRGGTSPVFDRAAHVLRFSGVRPGDFTLMAGNDDMDKRLQSLTVRPGHETVVDLRNRAGDIPPPPDPVLVTVTVLENGRPVSGAVVTWQSAPPSQTDPPAWQPAPPADLTDDTGTVRLPLEKGRHGLAVARVAGRLIGWAAFVATTGVNVRVEMRPAHSLAIALSALPLVDGQPPTDWREVGVSSVGGGGEAAGPTPSAHRDGENLWIAEDLPLGTYHVQVKTDGRDDLAAQDVTLTDADPAVTTVRLETPPPATH